MSITNETDNFDTIPAAGQTSLLPQQQPADPEAFATVVTTTGRTMKLLEAPHGGLRLLVETGRGGFDGTLDRFQVRALLAAAQEMQQQRFALDMRLTQHPGLAGDNSAGQGFAFARGMLGGG